MRKLLTLAVCGVLALGAAACGDDDDADAGGTGSSSSGDQSLSGNIKIDGSSTVAPFAQAAQEAFQGENPDVKITVGTSGTGGGFEKFCAGETDISDASRPIKEDEEAPLCEKAGNRLRRGSGRQRRHRRRDQQGADRRLSHHRAAEEAVEQGLEGQEPQGARPVPTRTRSSSCSDPTRTPARSTSSPIRSTVRRASRARTTSPRPTTTSWSRASPGSDGGLGYFGFSYYEQNQDSLNLVGVGESAGDCVKPSAEGIQSGEYKPLSRPLFMYPSEKALKRPEVKAFMEYVIANYDTIAEASQIVPMTEEQAAEGEQELKTAESNAGA